MKFLSSRLIYGSERNLKMCASFRIVIRFLCNKILKVMHAFFSGVKCFLLFLIWRDCLHKLICLCYVIKTLIHGMKLVLGRAFCLFDQWQMGKCFKNIENNQFGYANGAAIIHLMLIHCPRSFYDHQVEYK